jgi:polygalacturonase
LECATGSYSLDGAGECTLCYDGWVSEAGATECTYCNLGIKESKRGGERGEEIGEERGGEGGKERIFHDGGTMKGVVIVLP